MGSLKHAAVAALIGVGLVLVVMLITWWANFCDRLYDANSSLGVIVFMAGILIPGAAIVGYFS